LYVTFSGRITNKLSQWVFNLIFLSRCGQPVIASIFLQLERASYKIPVSQKATKNILWCSVVRSQGGTGFVQCRHFADKGKGGVLQMRTSTYFWCKDLQIFWNFGVSARTRRRGSIFRDFARTSFMEAPCVCDFNIRRGTNYED